MRRRTALPCSLLLHLTQWAMGHLRPRFSRRIRHIHLVIYLLQA